MTLPPIVATSAASLLDAHDALLLDAYGVLVDSQRALPHAATFLRAIRDRNHGLLIVTNDSSRTPRNIARRISSLGVPLHEDEVLSSGSLLTSYFAARSLHGARCLVPGPEDSAAMVREAGGEVVPITPTSEFDAIVIGDESGFPFLETMDALVSALMRRLDRGDAVTLVLPNPDVLYPKADGAFGLGSGSVAALIEQALEHRYGAHAPRFERLGKPHTMIFEQAVARIGRRSPVMVGDQLATDILGANQAGIASALITTGVTPVEHAHRATAPLRPTYVLSDLSL